MALKRLNIIQSANAGCTITIDNIYLQFITIDEWNYNISVDSSGEILIHSDIGSDPKNIKAEMPSNAKVKVIIELSEDAHIFGNERMLSIAKVGARSAITLQGPKGRANLRQNLKVS